MRNEWTTIGEIIKGGIQKRHQVRVSDKLYQSVCRVIQEGRQVVSRVANWAMVETYWRVGCLIVEDEQQGKRKAEYGKAVLADLARRLTAEYGSGYDERNLRYMRKFYLAFPIRNALRSELSWTHYRSLMMPSSFLARIRFGAKSKRKRNSSDFKCRIWSCWKAEALHPVSRRKGKKVMR